MRIALAILCILGCLTLAGCGGSSDGGEGAGGSQWDEMSWDQGQWR